MATALRVLTTATDHDVGGAVGDDASVAGDNDDDARLVARAKDDRAAFADIYRRHFDGVYRFCVRSLGGVDRAEDAAQQVFEQALSALPRYREQGRFRSWLYAIAYRVVGQQRTRLRPMAPLESAAEVPAAGASVEDAALGDLERRALREAVTRLPRDQRRVVELRIAGYTEAEIARDLGRSAAAVRMLQLRAVDRLSREFVPGGRGGGSRHGT